nr:periplasmic heavy metal sensor [uncultured Desulfobacter sp.]
MTNYSIKKIVIFGTILLTCFTAYAFAHSGSYHRSNGHGYGMMDSHHRGGDGMMDGYHMGGHMWNDLSVEDKQKMHDQMNKFFSATQKLKSEFYQKRVELNQEYLKSEKDQAKIDALEKELFDLSSKIEKKHFDHTREMQKRFANKAPDFNHGMSTGRYEYGGCF